MVQLAQWYQDAQDDTRWDASCDHGWCVRRECDGWHHEDHDGNEWTSITCER